MLEQFSLMSQQTLGCPNQYLLSQREIKMKRNAIKKVLARNEVNKTKQGTNQQYDKLKTN